MQLGDGPVELFEHIGRVLTSEITAFTLGGFVAHFPQPLQPIPRRAVIAIEQIFDFALAIGLGNTGCVGIVKIGFLGDEAPGVMVVLNHG